MVIIIVSFIYRNSIGIFSYTCDHTNFCHCFVTDDVHREGGCKKYIPKNQNKNQALFGWPHVFSCKHLIKTQPSTVRNYDVLTYYKKKM